MDFKTKEYYQRNGEGHFIMRKGSIHQEVTTIINMHVPNRSFQNEATLTELINRTAKQKNIELRNFLNFFDLVFTENQQLTNKCSF